jgi:hypothetical protein
MNRTRKRLSQLFLVAFLFLCAATARAQAYKVESANSPAPEEIAAPVRDILAANSLRVTGPQGALCEIWLRKSVVASATPSQDLGIAFPKIPDGSLFGALRFAAAVKDYRGQEIKPGIYTLRYALQPVDGNHLGVSTYRDYLLLVPAALDTGVAPIAFKELAALSRKASGTGHPAVWSLLPADGAPATLPGVKHVEDGDLWILYFPIPIGPEGAAPSPTIIGLVIVGRAPEA